MVSSILAVLAVASACSAIAQQVPAAQTTEPPASFGTVMGHVSFAGSNAPARLVNIALQPVQVSLEQHVDREKAPHLSFTIYQTDLDGEYTIPHVAPGTYYVVVTEPGFLSPFAQFTPQEMEHPTPDVAQRMAATLPLVGVRANATATLDVVLQRGAEMSGVLRFDDGTPFVAGGVFVQRRAENGKWENTSSYSNRAFADADGHWEVSGLLPGEYRLRVVLSVNDRKQSALLGTNSSSSSYDKYTLSVYSGDTARERDAQIIKLEENQQLSGQDLTIPVSRLHAISGAVVDAATGQPLNAGKVELYYADDGSYAVSTSIDPDSRSFTFNFVPEGDYRLKVADAREVRLEPPPDQVDSSFPERSRREVVVRRYAPGAMPLSIQGEITGISLPVEVKTAKLQ